MRKIVIAAFVIGLASPVLGQQPPANPDAKTPAVNSPNTTNPGAPAKGANSFTQGQAKSRIEKKGFNNVGGLKKDDAGVWRGKAKRGGKTVDVSVDFQGNVVAQ